MGVLLQHFDKTGALQLTGKSWPVAYPGVANTPEKFFVRNAGDEASLAFSLAITQVGSDDGASMIRCALDTATVLPPYGLAAALSAAGDGGVWAATGMQYYVLTAYNATGETVASVEVSVNVDVVTKRVTLTWSTVAGATGYKLYRATASGTYGASSLRATINGGSTATYVDDGTATGAGTPPTANTTGGAAPNYGSAPTLGTGPLAIGILAVGQWVCYWINRVVPAGTPGRVTARQALRRFSEAA